MKTVFNAVIFLLVVGALTYLSVRYGFGRLPGDIIIDRGGVVIWLPITTAISVSVTLALLLWLIRS